MDGLTSRRNRFIELYIALGGNGTEAARRAGYCGSANTLGVTAYRLLRNPKVAAAIRAKQDANLAEVAASTEAKRQMLWKIATDSAQAEPVEQFVDEDQAEDGSIVRLVCVKVRVRDPKSAIDAIRELNRMDGDYAELRSRQQTGTFEQLLAHIQSVKDEPH